MQVIVSTKNKLDINKGAYWLCPSWHDCPKELDSGLIYKGQKVMLPSPENTLESGTALLWICVTKNGSVFELERPIDSNSQFEAKAVWGFFTNAPR